MLLKIVETKKEEVRLLKSEVTMAAYLQEISHLPATLGFGQALTNSTRQISVIAEVKKASPSKGVIRENFHPLDIVDAYNGANVEAISVLTDRPYFQGDISYLREIRKHVQIPLLRKDFIIDELQIAEARVNGADCILLIAAILDGATLHYLSQVASELGLDVLLEVHDQEELEKALKLCTPTLLGINNRNLKTFHTDLKTTEKLLPLVPVDVPVVSESGIRTAADIASLHANGARAVLVGEHFMRQTDISTAVIDLVGARPLRTAGDMR